MYYLLYEANGQNVWELVSGEDAMQIRVGELMDELDLNAEDIVVFDSDDVLE